MNKIITLEELQEAVGERVALPQDSVTPSMIKIFGNITGDDNRHNHIGTTYFPIPVVQGSLLFALFGKYHKQRCSLTERDPVLGATRMSPMKGVPVNRTFTPYLTVTEVITGPPLKIVWLYELVCDNEPYFQAKVLYCYPTL